MANQKRARPPLAEEGRPSRASGSGGEPYFLFLTAFLTRARRTALLTRRRVDLLTPARRAAFFTRRRTALLTTRLRTAFRPARFAAALLTARLRTAFRTARFAAALLTARLRTAFLMAGAIGSVGKPNSSIVYPLSRRGACCSPYRTRLSEASGGSSIPGDSPPQRERLIQVTRNFQTGRYAPPRLDDARLLTRGTNSLDAANWEGSASGRPSHVSPVLTGLARTGEAAPRASAMVSEILN